MLKGPELDRTWVPAPAPGRLSTADAVEGLEAWAAADEPFAFHYPVYWVERRASPVLMGMRPTSQPELGAARANYSSYPSWADGMARAAWRRVVSGGDNHPAVKAHG